jgi:hypothetical protein
MTFFGLLPVAKLFLADSRSGWPDDLGVLGFFGGTAFLTAWSFRPQKGNASTPAADVADSRKVWFEKISILGIAVLCAGMIICAVQSAFGILAWRDFGVGRAMEPVLFLIVVVCSTCFWTLLARSVLGGIVLTGVAQLLLYLLMVVLARWVDAMAEVADVTRLSHASDVHPALLRFIAAAGLSYATLMLWLARRTFVTQSAGH